jgi:hypothetical protein
MSEYVCTYPPNGATHVVDPADARHPLGFERLKLIVCPSHGTLLLPTAPREREAHDGASAARGVNAK